MHAVPPPCCHREHRPPPGANLNLAKEGGFRILALDRLRAFCVSNKGIAETCPPACRCNEAPPGRDLHRLCRVLARDQSSHLGERQRPVETGRRGWSRRPSNGPVRDPRRLACGNIEATASDPVGDGWHAAEEAQGFMKS
jgi:hypothetical protein